MKPILSTILSVLALAFPPVRSPATSAAPPLTADRPADFTVPSLGRSQAIHVRFSLPGDTVSLPIQDDGRNGFLRLRWAGSDGIAEPIQHAAATPLRLTAPSRPGDYALAVDTGDGFRPIDTFRLLVKVPAGEARGGRIRGYAVGRWPSAQRGRYAPPDGFTEVTEANQSLPVSRHFRLRDFLTHDQADVWPKFVVVDTLLLDKLELLIREVTAAGHAVGRLHVMSGFRTPQYNARGLDQGRAVLSRHQYGDAADVWVDADGDGAMDDLDRDGRRTIADARVLAALADRVENRFPHLAGGIGVYPANSVHGPFVHVDVRGTAARW
jgi:uncharacterized protein YcbK (DUF882 family)